MSKKGTGKRTALLEALEAERQISNRALQRVIYQGAALADADRRAVEVAELHAHQLKQTISAEKVKLLRAVAYTLSDGGVLDEHAKGSLLSIAHKIENGWPW